MAQAIRSGIKLELHLYTRLADDERNEKLSINYEMKYGGSQVIWTENCANTLHKSQQIIVEYMLAHPSQKIELIVTATN